MRKSFILFFVNLVAVATFASTAVINFTGQTEGGDPCSINKVLVENLSQGWSETITNVTLTLDVVNSQAVDVVPAERDFVVVNNGQDGVAQVLFDMRKSGHVSAYVYDISGRCICQSQTEQDAGWHELHLEFAVPQIYYLHISTPDRNFSCSLLNTHSGNNSQIYYTAQRSLNRIPKKNFAARNSYIGDEMRYTGYVISNGEEYTDIKQEALKEGVTNILFVFDISKADYYIKHPWGTGEDADWTWQPMKKESAIRYTFSGLWGGVGANINTSESDTGAEWFPKSSISGSASMVLGDRVTFVYNPSASSLAVEGQGSGGGTVEYYIKHPWGSGNDEDWAWKKMTKVSNNEYTYAGKWGSSGANINTEPDDVSATWFPLSSINNSSNVWLGQDVTFTYNVVSSSLSVSASSTPTETLPTAPTGLKVVDENDYRIEIEWNAVSNAVYYQVYRATSASGTYSKLGGYTQVCSYMDVNVTTGSTYYYKVSAINGEGEGPKSAAVSGTARTSGGGGGTTLSAPTGVTATASSSYITVNWNSVSGATKYKVYRATSSSGSYSSIATEYGTSHQDRNATSGTTYYYKVTAVASNGSESAKSSAASATIGGGGGGTTSVAAPTGVQANYMSYGNKVQVLWNTVALCDDYEIYRSKSASSGFTKVGNAGNTSVYVDQNLPSGDQYYLYYKIKAKSSYLNKTSDYSEVATTFVDKNPSAPCAPMNLRVTGSSSITIKWDKNSSSGCGIPSSQVVSIYNYSTNSWVDKSVTTNSCTLTSTEVSTYLNGTRTLNIIIKVSNSLGKACLSFDYNTSTQQTSNVDANSCY